MSFTDIITGAKVSGDTAMIETVVSDDWHQGRTAYGGLSSALALHAATRAGGDGLAPLRSAQISMIAPVTGRVSIHAEVLRRGRNATWVSARITDDAGKTGLTATFVFMGPVSSAFSLDGLAPPADLIAPLSAKEFANPHAPAFLRHHFDVRFARPKGEVKQAEMCWWVRARDHGVSDGISEVVLIADALPPGIMPLISPKIPVSTMQWQINILDPVPVTQDWWLLRSVGKYAAQGCSSQQMTVWNSDGKPVASSIQSIAFFG